MEDKLFGFLGLARRAGKITFGSDAVLRDAAEGKAALIVLSNDVAERTAKNIRAAGERYGISVLTLPAGKQMLGHAIGRGETAVAAVTDKSFAKGINEICRTSLREEDC